jgi:hypothetical protein
MIDKKSIADYAGQETLSGTDLIEILFWEPLGFLEESLRGHIMYPDMSSKVDPKKLLAYESLADGMIARFHPTPTINAKREHLLAIDINLREFCYWFSQKPKRVPNSALSHEGRLFVKSLGSHFKTESQSEKADVKEDGAEPQNIQSSKGRPPFPYSKVFIEAVKAQAKKGTPKNVIPFMGPVTRIFAQNVPNKGKVIDAKEYGKTYGWSLRIVRKNVIKALAE